MDVMDGLKVVTSGYHWVMGLLNPARQLSSRVLEVLDAHGVSRSRINALLPQQLRLPAMAWSNADQLKLVIHQGHIDWLIERFDLQREWLEGDSHSANTHIFCYKQPELLSEWLISHSRTKCFTDLRLHVVVSDSFDAHRPRGPFAIILEVLAEDKIDNASRFYHVGEGAYFEHYPCLIHLVQVQAITHCHGAIMWRSTLHRSALDQLSRNIGLIPALLHKRRSHNSHAADHELWSHFSGSAPWLTTLRQEAMSGLRAAGLGEIVDRVELDQARYLSQRKSPR